MKNISLLVIGILLIVLACVTNPNVIKFGNGEQLVPEDIVENWEFVGEECLGDMVPKDCPNTSIHVHIRMYNNPNKESEVKSVLIEFNKDIDKIVGVTFYIDTTLYMYSKLCGSTSWKQYSPDPNKSI